MFTQQHQLLVACSGGVDSMVLCHLLNAHHFRFSIAHCNFQLRGNESDEDEQLVRKYGLINDVQVFVKHFSTQAFADKNKISIQVAARELRYDWFNELLENHHLDFVLTAHHADDNVETVLMNIFRGTGILGIKGMMPKRDKIVRPLLFVSKKEIISYAKENGIDWREDASNASEKYTRNFFRNRIIPQVEEVIPNASVNVIESIKHFQEAETLYQQAIEYYRKNLMHIKNDEVHIPVVRFAAVNPFDSIAYELLRPYGFSAKNLEDIKELLKAETGRYIASETYRIIKNRKWLIIAPLSPAVFDNIVLDEKDEVVLFENARLLITKSTRTEFAKDALTATLDAKKVCFPMLLRKWKAGDYFYPLGMPKKKKVARLLIDLKLSQTEKEKVWVLESNNKIIWVVGYRIDDRFKVGEGTKKVLRIQLVKQDK